MYASLISKIKKYNHENGFGRSALWIASKSMKTIATAFVNPRTTYIIEKSLEGETPFMKAKMDVTFRTGGIDDFASFRDVLRPWHRFLRIFEDRLMRGQTSIVCYHHSRAIGYIWMTDRAEIDKNLGFTIKPKNDESYGFDLYVMPAYRKDLVGFELISRWLRHAREAGKRTAIGAVASYNHPMFMTTKLVFGFRKTKEVRSIEFFRRRGFVIAEKEIS